MRRFDITPRRATPKGHNPFISHAAPRQEIYLHRPLSALVAHLKVKLRASTPSCASSSAAPEASTAPIRPSPSSCSPADRSPSDYPTNNPTSAQDDPHPYRESPKT